ncbi:MULTISPECIES: IclR family transcriptional regulator [unclassified Rhodococcus (in: high G+C Gram-positive bacteria)]|jgi:DNA-binding IclR family transcriptional regulator|uniref:IclR family transcriptional regulator n=1 Tax=unclassified Rhodococcus (in: high G+C Gram-positive bacteria) TaxID=192944 RepID=UPI00131FD664|nr:MULTISPECIES: IclR family transcriptional regulator [unclassified Rhodococcus (in: high G+C Gram-positive bacteria)]QHE68608.1 Transcriptional regulator, IclR family [Rhodococcus sp. WAY2]
MTEETRGPHVVGRVGALLRAVGAHEPAGASTTVLGRAAGLARPTAHRLLSSLADEGLLDRDAKTGRWTLGPELYLLGAAAATRYDITRHARGVLDRLARETGESAFLSARRGDETVCIAAEDGSFPLRSHVLHEGIRFPLGVASAGLVILAHLPDRDIDEYLARTDLSERWGENHSTDALRERIALTRHTGYAVNPGLIVEGSWGMGAAVFDRDGRPAWALSLTGVETRFRPERHPELGTLLLEQAHVLSQLLQSRA